MADQPTNTTSTSAGSAVDFAALGKDAVAKAMAGALGGVSNAVSGAAGGSSTNSGAGVASALLANANPTAAYVQAGAQALQALSDSGPTGAPNSGVGTFNHAPVNINFGGGSISSSSNPTTTPTTTASGGSGSGILGGLSNTVTYLIIGIVAIVAVKSLRKAA